MTLPEKTQTAFGIRISLPEGDPFAHLIDDNWQTTHWYPTQTARNTALEDMRREHEYSRHGDRPTLVFKGIEGKPS
jgi:hypothetical protein